MNENDLGSEPQPQVNYKQHRNFKRMVSESAMKAGKTRRTGNVNKDGPYMNGRISYGDAGEGKKNNKREKHFHECKQPFLFV